MKRMASIVLCIIMLMTNLVAFSEETPDTPHRDGQYSYTPEENAYKEYFEVAYRLAAVMKTECEYISDFLRYITKEKSLQDKDFSFVLTIDSALCMNAEQLRNMNLYRTATNSDYSSMSAAINISRTLPAWLELFEALEKPAVPENFTYVDTCLTQTVDQIRLFYAAAIEYLQAKKQTDRPYFSSQEYTYLTIVYSLIK